MSGATSRRVGTVVGPQGIPGRNGQNGPPGPPGTSGGSSTTVGSYTQPPVDDGTGTVGTVSVTFNSSLSPSLVGTGVAIGGGGSYLIKSVAGPVAVLINGGSTGSGNANPGTVITSGATVVFNGVSAQQSAVPRSGQTLMFLNGKMAPADNYELINLRRFGPCGNGNATEDTAALTAAFAFFSGSANLVCGSLFIPNVLGGLLLNATLNYVGNNFKTFRIMGQSASSFISNSCIKWVGTAGQDMMIWKGVNNSWMEHIVLDGNFSAASCLWIQTNQPAGGNGSNNITFEKCFFQNCVGLFPQGPTGGFTYIGTQGLVKIGNLFDTEQVSTIKFDDCTFTGTGGGVGQTFAAVNVLAGANTEAFHFDNCQFSGSPGMQYNVFASYAANSEISFRDCQMGATVAFVYVRGSTQTILQNCHAENGTGGIIYDGGQSDSLIIDGGEMILDVSGNTRGLILQAGGRIHLRGVFVYTNNTSVPAIGIGAASAGYGSLTVEGCTWGGTFGAGVEQIPVFDGNGNNLTLLRTLAYGGGVAYSQTSVQRITLRNNTGSDAAGVHYVLPNFEGGPLQIHNAGMIWGNGTNLPAETISGTPGMHIIAVNQTRVCTSIFQIGFQAIASVAGSSNTYTLNVFNLPKHVAILSVAFDIQTAFSGGTISDVTCSVGDGGATGAIGFLKAASIHAASGTNPPIGAASGDIGTLLSGAVQGKYWGAFNSTNRQFQIFFTSTGDKLNNLTAGLMTFYITTEGMVAI